MGPDGSIWAHIKTGRSHMAQDHFKTPSDPKTTYEDPEMTPQKTVKNPIWKIWLLFLGYSLIGNVIRFDTLLIGLGYASDTLG